MKSFRRFLRVLGLLLIVSHGIAVCDAQAPPMRIMPLGDSLTSGTTVQGAYRNTLYNLLSSAGFNVDFVGTQADTNNPTLPDRDHQGMGGYRIDQIEAGLSSWFGVIEDPDVILLMIGTNDFSANFDVASAQTRLAGLVADIATRRPFAKIIVASLPLRTDNPSLEALQSTFNAAIPGIVNDQVALGRQVSFVDMHSALLPGDLVEGVHPSVAGYDKMANAWLPAVTSVITPLGTSNPPAILRTEPAVDLQHIAVKFSKPLADSASSLSNFSLDGGLAISQAVLDPVTKRTVTLTTSAQTPGKLYTLTVSGVRDRTPQQNLIAPGSTVAYSSFSLVNGSFEAGETGWTMTGNYLVYGTNPPYIASAGSAMLVMNGGQSIPNAVVSQTFATVPGQTYALDFDIGVLAINSAGQVLRVDVTGAAPLLSQIESVFGNSLGNSVWTPKSRTFTADSASTTLTFRDQSPTSDGVDLLLDNVRVTAMAAPVNTAPVAVADFYSASRDTALVVPAAGVLENDVDAQSNPLTAVLNAAPSHGGVTLNPNGGFTYTPASGYSGPDSFTYHANDGILDSNVVAVNITVSAVPPGTLVNGSFEAGETGWTMTGNYFVYNTNPPYSAFDGVTMVVMNGAQSTPNAVVSQTFATTPGQSYVLDFNVGILATNFSEQRLGVALSGATPLVSQIESLFGNAQANSVWSAKSYPFTADSTTTTLTFQDQSPSSNGLDLLLDNVRVTATGSPPNPNTAPVAVTDSYSTNQGTALVVPAAGVLVNDTDAESNALTAILNAGPGHGNLALNPNGGFSYTPSSGYTGPDSFTYHANDGSLDSNIVTVSIAVNVVNTAPVAVADSYSTNMDTALIMPAAGVLANDSDAQSNALTAVSDAGPAHGNLSLNSNGGFTYTPAAGYTGPDSFTYHANDGSLDSNIVAVSLTIIPPVSSVLVNGSFESNFTGWTSTGNQSIEFYPGTDGSRLVAFNSRDLTPNGVLSQTFPTVAGKTYTLSFDAGVLSYVKKQQKIQVTVSGTGGILSQTVTLNGTGDGVILWASRSFTFVANSATSTLIFRDRSTTTVGLDMLLDNVRVNGPPAFPNAAPVALADSWPVNKNTTLVVPAAGVLANDTDPQSDALTAILDAGPSHGGLTLNTNGGFSYTPATGYTGPDSFTYHAKDGSLNSNTVAVSITVNEVPSSLLVNSSFESDFTGWTTAGNQSIEYYSPTDGIKVAAFNSHNLAPNAVLSQTFATTSGQTYSLTFDAGVLAYSTDSQKVQVTVAGSGNLLSQSVTVVGAGGGVTRWSPQSFIFTANSASTTLTFQDQSTVTNGIDLLLDNVRVFSMATATIAPPPPENLGTPSLAISPGEAVIRMTAPQAGIYVLERSEDLTNWQAVESMQCVAQEPVEFHDIQDSLSGDPPKQKMFYRVGFQAN